MFAKDLISPKIPLLKLSDTGKTVLELMNEQKLCHLPLVSKHKYIGLISEKDILTWNDLEMPIEKYKMSFFSPFVRENQHFFDAVELAAGLQLTVIPVLNENEEYAGSIPATALLSKTAALLNTGGPGSIIVLQTNNHDYVLSEIARIVEHENVQILSFSTNLQSNGFLHITLKLNSENINSVLKSLERYNYEICAYFTKTTDETDTFQKRLQELFHYLQI